MNILNVVCDVRDALAVPLMVVLCFGKLISKKAESYLVLFVMVSLWLNQNTLLLFFFILFCQV